MISEILKKNEELFRNAELENTPRDWEKYVIEMTGRLSKFPMEVLEKLVNEARQKRQVISNAKKEKHLWILSHASKEILKEFISDPELHRPFASILTCHQRRFWKDDFKKTGLGDFTWRYATLLQYTYFYVTSGVSSPVMNLIPKPISNPESFFRLTAGLRQEIASRELDEYLSLSFLPLCLTNISQEQQIELTSAIADKVELEDAYDWDTPPKWQWLRLNQVDEMIYKIISNGNWPIFFEHPKSILNPTKVEVCWKHPIRGMREIIEPYLTKETIELEERLREIKHGRLPVGLKVHSLKPKNLKIELFRESSFRLEQASACIILPPVGNANAAKEILDIIEDKTGHSFLDNPDFQIQVCSPGELTDKNAAILGICFYLGSDELRMYERADFITTQNRLTGGRLIVYGAEQLNRNFDWWGKDKNGKLQISSIPDSIKNRTDVLTCASLLDIENVNLVATLLIHSQHNGFWANLGERFIKDTENILTKYGLSDLLSATWIYGKKEGANGMHEDDDGALFFEALSKLTVIAREDAQRVNREKELGIETDSGILFEFQVLLQTYKTVMEERAVRENIGGAR